MIEVTVNGTRHRFPPGLTLWQALAQAGIALPGICHDERVPSGGDCRLCSVEADGQTVPACREPLVTGMRIETHTPALEAFRRTTLALLAGHCSAEAAAALPEKPFHRLLAHYDVAPAGVADAAGVDVSHPCIRVDMSQCVHCHRCIRVCDDLQGQFVWHLLGRGHDGHVVHDRGARFVDSSCVACGACVDACPSGALVDAFRWQNGAAQQWTRTTCVYCGVGCEIELGARDGRLVAARPRADSPVNKGHLCVKGRYAWDFAAAPDRVTTPLVRAGGDWQPTSWEVAIGQVVTTLQHLKARHGPDSIAVLGSSRATNEENYLAQKFARAVIGTNNVDCCARVCHTPTAAAMKRMLGTGAATNAFDDIEQAQAFLLAGTNAAENHPVVAARIRQQVRRGAALVVVDPRCTELAAQATVHLALRPGTDIPLYHAMAHVMFSEGLADEAFLAARADGVEAFRECVAAWPPEKAATVCGVDAGQIRAAARLYATRRPAMCFHGLGLTEHLQGTEAVMAVVNLALVTGNIGRPGAGINPLRGQNNVQGAAMMGCDPSILTGGQSHRQARAHFAAVWGTPLPEGRGHTVLDMIDAAADGRLKALYVIGYDIFLSLAHSDATRRALERLELLVIQDLYINETARHFGHVFLPVASSFEKDGTFMNAERRIQRVRRVVAPPAGVRDDAQVIAALAAGLGSPARFDFESAAGIWDEIRAVWPAVAGIAWHRLDDHGIQWPCPTTDHPGTTVLHEKAFAHGPRAPLQCLEYLPTPERVSDDYPWLLTTGRTLVQFNAGTMTSRTPLAALRDDDTLDMSPADARAQGFTEGEQVRLVSRHGETQLPLRIDARIAPGQLFASFHTARRFVNRVTSPVRDRITGAPEYKVTAVRVERLAAGRPAQA